MDRTKTLTGAALAALALAACGHQHHKAAAKPAADPASAVMGECHGVNECKGKGACGNGADSACAGQNTCKGLGWISLSKGECEAKKGTFKGG